MLQSFPYILPPRSFIVLAVTGLIFSFQLFFVYKRWIHLHFFAYEGPVFSKSVLKSLSFPYDAIFTPVLNV